MKKIYFCADLEEATIPDEALSDCRVSWADCMRAITDGDEVIWTTQLSFLADASDLNERGYELHIRKRGGDFLVHKGCINADGKEISLTRNFEKLFIGEGAV